MDRGTRLRGLARIPLLVKFIFPEQKLSVQVHPDDAYAEQHGIGQRRGRQDGDVVRGIGAKALNCASGCATM